jgi:hypothetical protein
MAQARSGFAPFVFFGGKTGMGMGSGRHRGPGNRNHTKDRGDLTEMEFMVQAARRGLAVAKPYGDNEHYDIMVDAGHRVWRVQVKLSGARHHRGFTVRSSWRTSHKQRPYSPEDVDFLAVLIGGHGIWYLIPIIALEGRLTIHLYPFGSRRGSSNRFEGYRGAWNLLEENAPSTIPGETFGAASVH